MVTAKDVDELVKLRDSAARGAREALRRYNEIAQDFIYARQNPQLIRFFDDFLASRVSEEKFRQGIGFPKLPLEEYFDQFIEQKRTKNTLSREYEKQLRFQIPRFIAWMEERGIHPSDLTRADIETHVLEKGANLASTSAPVKAFFRWIAREKDIPIKGSVAQLTVETRKEEDMYYRIFIDSTKTTPVSQFGLRTFPEEGWVLIREQPPLWFYSEVNLVYSTIHRYWKRWEDWERLEIINRIWRETGLRIEHSLYLRWQDVDFTGNEHGGIPCIDYKGIKKYERLHKNMPSIESPISPLLSARIANYLRMYKPPLGECIVQSKRASRVYRSIRLYGGFSACRKSKVEHYRPTTTPYCPKMFRHSFATLICNLVGVQDSEIWQRFGDLPGRVRMTYSTPGLVKYYEGIGLRTFDDILKVVFSNEGLYENEKPSTLEEVPGEVKKRRGRPPGKKAEAAREVEKVTVVGRFKPL
jgi:integrase